MRRVASDPRAGHENVQALQSTIDRAADGRCACARVAAELRMLQIALSDAEDAIARVLDLLHHAAVGDPPAREPLSRERTSPPSRSEPTADVAATHELAGRLRAALRNVDPAGASDPPHPPAPRHGVAELLTDREAEVLEDLSARLSNKEIAERLSISPHTVKRHTISLYQKLGVQGRREAVARARMLGLLPSQ
jgi:ATP/maltotriose-dependent transcriptional regulator MalT